MCPTRDIQFKVSLIDRRHDGLVVTGQCVGDTIVLGDTFDKVYAQLHDADWEEESWIANPKPVFLTVQYIQPFEASDEGQDWDFVDPLRYTRLELRGEGCALVTPDVVLANHCQEV